MDGLPQYQSHKRVWAAPIAEPAMLTITGKGQPQVTVLVGDERKPIDVPGDIFARGEPSPGDYLVVYPDGYKSWSPKGAFEEGYIRVEGH